MSAEATSIPQSREDFESQLGGLLQGLEGRSREDLTHEVVAKHILEASEDRVPNFPVVVVGTVDASFIAGILGGTGPAGSEPQLIVSRKALHGSQPIYEGTNIERWDGTSTGTLVNVGPRYSNARYFAFDCYRIPWLSILLELLIIFFYNEHTRKFAVFVGPAIGNRPRYQTGTGQFLGF